MTSRWFRFYDSVLDDPKVQRLPDHIFRGWVNVLCLASRGAGELPQIPDIAFALRIPDDAADSLVQALLDAGLIEDAGDRLIVHNWSERQFTDKTNALRQKRFREKNRLLRVTSTDSNAVTNAVSNNEITSVDTEQNRTEQNIIRDGLFDEFWKIYPRKMSIVSAEVAFIEARRNTDPNVIIDKLKSYVWPDDMRYIPSPARWLRDRRWEDDCKAVKPAPRERDLRGVPDNLLSADDYWRKRRQMQG
jgi:hypothetical protein